MNPTNGFSHPSAQDVARRLLVLRHVVAFALTAPPRGMLQTLMEKWNEQEQAKFKEETQVERDRFWGLVRDHSHWGFLAPSELKLATTTICTMTSRQQVDASWRMESVQALMWALRLLENLPPYDIMASHELLKRIPSRDITTFIASACLRDQSEISKARDLAEMWHWRSRTRQLIESGRPFPDNAKMKARGFSCYDDIVRFTARMSVDKGNLATSIGDDFPARGKAYRDLSPGEWSEVRSITVERHFALNWLCGYAPGNHLDETPTGT